jgi:hypothetical protein
LCQRSGTLTNRRVLAAAAGIGQFSDLDPNERAAAHALIDAGIAGLLIEIAPDGSRRRL